MAITARFEANFVSFHDAVQKAEVKLVDFAKGAGKVEGALTRMADSFSGRKVISEAALMEKAIGGIEGLSKLTESELRKVGNTASDAVDKMKRIGVEVPPGLQKLYDATKPVNLALTQMTESFSGRKIIAEAAMVEKAIGGVGGLSKLTGSEFQRVGVQAAEAVEKMKKLGIEVPPGLQKIYDATKPISPALQTITDTSNQMTESFSGRKIVAEAALMEKAIGGIGGLSKLTASELQQVGTTAGAAVEKMKKLGIEVPPGLQKIYDATKPVNIALMQMTESFSGRKIIAEAALMEQALGGVEGVSKLTESELRRVGATAGDALEKMKKLGIEVPPGLQKIYDATKPIPPELQKIPSMFSKITGALGPLGPLVAGAFSVGAIIGFGKEILGNADALVRLRDKTGISLAGLQDLSAAAKQSGNSIEQVTGAVSQMQNRLASGDASAVAAVKTLGISFSALKSQDPDEQFRSIARAIASIEDPAKRTQLAMDAFGRAGAEILPTLLSDMDKIAAGTVKMSDESIEALDRVGDAWDRFYANTKATAANALVAFADFAKATAQFSANPTGEGSGLTIPPRRFTVPKSIPLTIGEAAAAVGLPTPEQMEKMDREFAAFRRTVDAAVVTSAKPLQEALTRYRDLVPTVGQAVSSLNQKTQESIRVGLALGVTQSDLVTIYGVTARQVKAVSDTLDFQRATVAATDREFGKLLITVPNLSSRTATFQHELSLLSSTTNEFHNGMSVAGDVLSTVVIPAFSTLPTLIPRSKQALEDIAAAATAAAEKANELGVAFSRIPDHLIAAFTGGGGLSGALKAIAVDLGSVFADTLTDTMTTRVNAGLSGFSAKGLKSAAGLGAIAGVGVLAGGGSTRSALGSAAGAGVAVGAGALASGATLSAALALGAATLGVGAAAVVAYVAVKKLLNDSEKKVNPIRQAFIDAAGGLDLLNQRAVGAGATLTALLDAKNPVAYKAAIDELNRAFEFQDTAMKLLDETVTKYGFTLDQLGPTLSKQKLDEQAKQLIVDFSLLERAGIDVNNISIQMSSSINEYLRNALKTGSAVPEAMREILNQLVTMGLLTDENGVLITDLEETGVTFAKTLEGQFSTLLETIEKLTDAISRGLGLAIDNVPDVDVNVTRRYRDMEEVGGLPDVVGAARGGSGRVTKPTLFLAGEAGAEDFAFSGGGQRFGGSGRSGQSLVNNTTVNIYGGKFNTPSDRLRAANEISQALMDEQRLERRLNVA